MSTTGPSSPAPRAGHRIPTRTLTIANIVILILGGPPFVLAHFFGFPSFYPLAVAFPTVGALVVAPVEWAVVLAASVLIAAVSTRPSPARPWWPRFYRKLAWCGIAVIPLSWLLAGVLLASATSLGVS